MGKRFYVLPAEAVVGLRRFGFEEAVQRADELVATDGKPRVIVGLESEICSGTPEPVTTRSSEEK